VSYSIGVSVIQNFKQHRLSIDLDVVMQGMKDALGDRKLLLTEEELRATLTAVQTDIRRAQRQAGGSPRRTRKTKGMIFRPRIVKDEGVVSLPIVLQHKILKAGDGRKPTDAGILECRRHELSTTESSSTALPELCNPGTSRSGTPFFPGVTEAQFQPTIKPPFSNHCSPGVFAIMFRQSRKIT
jgi:hypothetical protein